MSVSADGMLAKCRKWNDRLSAVGQRRHQPDATVGYRTWAQQATGEDATRHSGIRDMGYAPNGCRGTGGEEGRGAEDGGEEGGWGWGSWRRGDAPGVDVVGGSGERHVGFEIVLDISRIRRVYC
jgi:hypothetical protein